ncbi:hypothetical protein EHS25_003506 [Saitozyma podzolica]|uniref:Uncharacterized protein n=1 Tax=Saitozyma podzolica TaxID=1890683 RepID=A0A427Y7F7_9TREE|nr:hypothetical protein EHS25_003506 [Saitozyma podzolica]
MRFFYLCAMFCGIHALAVPYQSAPWSSSSTLSATDSGACTISTATSAAGTTPPPLPSSHTSGVTVTINVTLSAAASA